MTLHPRAQNDNVFTPCSLAHPLSAGDSRQAGALVHDCRTRGVRHVDIRPRTPHLKGKVERSHRVDAQEFYQLLDQDGITDDIHLFDAKLREKDYYNYHRPHGALNGQTPFERLMAETRADVLPRV